MSDWDVFFSGFLLDWHGDRMDVINGTRDFRVFLHWRGVAACQSPISADGSNIKGADQSPNTLRLIFVIIY